MIRTNDTKEAQIDSLKELLKCLEDSHTSVAILPWDIVKDVELNIPENKYRGQIFGKPFTEGNSKVTSLFIDFIKSSIEEVSKDV